MSRIQPTMKALQVTEPGLAVIRDVPTPKPSSGEVLLEVEAVATCPHWDIHILDGVPMFSDRPLEYPYVLGEPGHETVGRVVALGDGVTELSEGDRVAAWRDPGGRRQGCYAQYVALDADHVLAIPDSLDAVSVASLELAMCVQVSVDQLAEINALHGRRVAVAGLGPSGLIAIQLLRMHNPSEIVAVEPDESRHALALDLGVDVVLTPDQLPAEDRFGADAFFAALDSTGLKRSIEALMPRTTRAVAIFGVLRETIEFGPNQWWGGFSLIGYGEHNRGAAERALDAIQRGALNLAPLISERRPLSEYAGGVEALRQRRAIKVLFDPWVE